MKLIRHPVWALSSVFSCCSHSTVTVVFRDNFFPQQANAIRAAKLAAHSCIVMDEKDKKSKQTFYLIFVHEKSS